MRVDSQVACRQGRRLLQAALAGLTRFLEDPRLTLDDNLSERQLRSVAAGRGNYVFASSDAGAEHGATPYSVVQTCKLNGRDPYAWVADVQDRLAVHPSNRCTGRSGLDDLLPWNWKPAGEQQVEGTGHIEVVPPDGAAGARWITERFTRRADLRRAARSLATGVALIKPRLRRSSPVSAWSFTSGATRSTPARPLWPLPASHAYLPRPSRSSPRCGSVAKQDRKRRKRSCRTGSPTSRDRRSTNGLVAVYVGAVTRRPPFRSASGSPMTAGSPGRPQRPQRRKRSQALTETAARSTLPTHRQGPRIFREALWPQQLSSRHAAEHRHRRRSFMVEVVVLSDLHIGGDPHDASVPGDRGFAMFTMGAELATFIGELAADARAIELVIAGDFLDFLAERSPEKGRAWVPFHTPEYATQVFETIVTREPRVFGALRAFCASDGHRLTVMVGNHDIEMALPSVRDALCRTLGERSVRLVYNNEPVVFGNLYIEHGNQYDPMNRVDWDPLLRLCAECQRAPESVPTDFQAPAGSRLVAQIMNPTKSDYPFVDLLKPETRGVIPVLLALAPRLAQHAPGVVARLVEGTWRDKTSGHGLVTARAVSTDNSDVDTLISEAFPDIERFAKAVHNVTDDEISIGRVRRRRGGAWDTWACKALQYLLATDRAWQLDGLPDEYVKAAQRVITSLKHTVVVMGHTHLARWTPLDGGVYINTGTWADLIRFPPALSQSSEAENALTLDATTFRKRASPAYSSMTDPLEATTAFLDALHSGDTRVVDQRPTYAWITLSASMTVTEGRLCVYRIASRPLANENVLRHSTFPADSD